MHKGQDRVNIVEVYFQCYNCNNLFMHKGQDQVNIVEVYVRNTLADTLLNI